MIELNNVDEWRRSISAISSFISEGNFRFNDKGISLRAIDPSQIVLVDYLMEKNSFDSFKIEPSFVGIDIVELSKIVDRALPKDKLLLDLTDSEMILTFKGELERVFSLPLMDVADSDVSLPESSFDAEIEIGGRILKEALKDASLFGSSVVLRVKDGQLSIEARGSQGALNTAAKQTKVVKVKSTAEVVGKYSLNFLQNIAKEVDADQKVKLEIKSDSPMKVSYPIGQSSITFYLAHMIL